MIVDSLNNFQKYFKGEIVDIIYESICSTDANHLLGEFKLIGNDLFYKVIEYQSKESDWITESHKKYIDIQIILSGEEIIKVYDLNSTKVKIEYDLHNDCIFYNIVEPDYLSKIILKNGYFCFFFPQDIHQTQIATNNNPTLVKKLVFKANEKFFA